MNKFVFKSYEFNRANLTASFKYSSGNIFFTEKVRFVGNSNYDENVLDEALFLSFVLVGTSYYKAYPSREVVLEKPIDKWQADFFDKVYQEGLGQFAFENNLTRDDLAHFKGIDSDLSVCRNYDGDGIIALQSGGKDSLLVASMLQEKNIDFVSLYFSNTKYHPVILDKIGSKLIVSERKIDLKALNYAADKGARNGHVPVTYILQSLAIIQAILLGKDKVLTSVGHEGEEPYSYIGDLPVAHQWSKTWQAESDFAEYVERYISKDIKIGSPIRCYSELKVAELFVEKSWSKYGNIFSSCNAANYGQGHNNTDLKWCGRCAKCVNSFLLFAPFLTANNLTKIFDDSDLFADQNLTEMFKGLLKIDNAVKLFECVGETDELRLAYQMAKSRGDYNKLSFDVPESNFDYKKTYPAQDWAVMMLK